MHIKLEDELQRLIAERAKELSEARGGEVGDEVNDWLKAEQEIRHEMSLRSSRLFIDGDI